jgi:hypothetical protein
VAVAGQERRAVNVGFRTTSAGQRGADGRRVPCVTSIADPNGAAQLYWKMEEDPSGSAIRSLIPSHRELLRPKAAVVSVAEKSGR